MMKMDNKAYYDVFPMGAGPKALFSMDTRRTQVNNNTLVVGGTGAGKTIGVAYPMLMHLQHGNAVGIFTKRGMTDSIRRLLEKRGYHIYEIDFCHPETSPFGYDPLKHCRDEVDIMALAHSIIYGKEDGQRLQDPFWYDSAESLLRPVLRYAWRGLYHDGDSLLDAVKLMDTIPMTTCRDWGRACEQIEDDEDNDNDNKKDNVDHGRPDIIDSLIERYHMTEDTKMEVKLGACPQGIGSRFQEEEKQEPKEPEDFFEEEDPKHQKLLLREIKALMDSDKEGAASWMAYINGPDNTRQSVMMALQTPLAQVFTPSIRCFLENPREFTFERLLEPKTVLFVYTSPVNAALSRFISIFYQQMFKCLFELAEKRNGGTLPHPVYVICDDFATGVPIDHFQDHISIFREKGISVTMLIQSETQLTGLYGEANAKTIINNCDTYIYLGGMDIVTAKAIAERMDCPYTDILNMEIGRELLFHRGQKPLRTKRYDLFHDPLYAECQQPEKVRQLIVRDSDDVNLSLW